MRCRLDDNPVNDRAPDLNVGLKVLILFSRFH